MSDVKRCEDFTCGYCKNFDACVKDSNSILDEVKTELSKNLVSDKLKAEFRKAERNVIEKDSEPCAEFTPVGEIPDEVQKAFMLVAPMSTEYYNLFCWKQETLHKLRELEEEFDVRLGEDFKNGDDVIGQVKDIRSDGRIIIQRTDGKKCIIKLARSVELDEDEE